MLLVSATSQVAPATSKVIRNVFYFSKYSLSLLTTFSSDREGPFNMKSPALKPYQVINVSSERT